MKTPVEIAVATGSTVTKDSLLKEDEGQLYDITEYGAVSEGDPVRNTESINVAIEAAARAGGGTVVVPAGDFKTYTIRLLDNVNIRIDREGIIRAARTDMYDQDGKLVEEGEGGNYDEPEVNLYVGLQDHGHTYFANSLFYAADKSSICIYGEGLVDGSYIDDDGYVQNTLSCGDPHNPEKRSQNGDQGTWFGNKGFSLVRCENVVIDGISILNGGHFAIIAEGVVNMTVEGITVDTNRDAFDVDCCQDVTVRNSRFNSLTDDAIVMKSSYGAGVFMPTHNVLIEDCVVSGYDAGSVINGTYTTDKLVATDQCGPTARVKLGTESTCGYDTVTVKNVRFERSRGFCLEAVDGSPMHDIIMTDCTMDNVSSSPIFIRIGDRSRYPILLSGLVDSRIKNVVLKDIEVEYRGGLSMKEAVEQRQIGTYWVYSQSGSAPAVQEVPWLVNRFFSKSEGLLPRVSYDSETDRWVDDPYNVPELPSEYPEPSILAYGLYARHVDGLTMENVKFSYIIEDTRPPIVLDDALDVDFTDISAEHAEGTSTVVRVTNNCKRHTNMEYVKNEPYFATTCFVLSTGGLDSEEVAVNAPAPGTPADDLYSAIRLPIPENGYSFAESTEEYELPLTVHRPYFVYIPEQKGKVGEEIKFTVSARNPANGIRQTDEEPEAVIEDSDEGLTYGVEGDLPAGATFDEETHTFVFTPEQAGEYEVTFTVDDGVIPMKKTVTIAVEESNITFEGQDENY